MLLSILKHRFLTFFVPYLLVLIILYLYSLKMSTVESDKPCIFCDIVNKKTDTVILYEDDEVCVFRDIKPASQYHVLVIPKRHIEDAKALVPNDKSLVVQMLAVGKNLLSRNEFSESNARLGFHWPPFRSVHHLHMHVIAPESEMGYIARLVFMKDSYWFVSPEYVISRL